jgi:hypothetical protein
MILFLRFVLSQVSKSRPGAPRLVHVQAVRDLVEMILMKMTHHSAEYDFPYYEKQH